MSRELFQYVYGAARTIDDAMTRTLGTGTPTLREMRDLAVSEKISLEPVYGSRTFKVELLLDGPGAYRIRYNATQLPIVQMLQIYHEVCEVMAVKHHPGLFDDDPEVTTFHYDGGSNPRDMRHLAALDCELRMIRRLNAAGYTVPRSVTISIRERTQRGHYKNSRRPVRCHCGCSDGHLETSP